jgi:hypothetical protein
MFAQKQLNTLKTTKPMYCQEPFFENPCLLFQSSQSLSEGKKGVKSLTDEEMEDVDEKDVTCLA